MRTVTFYSYKGGVGRTLALANFAIGLARVGQKVFAIDFDLEGPGLHYKLPPADEQIRGLVDLIHDFLRGAAPPDSLSAFAYSYPVAMSSADDAEIRLMPAGQVSRSAYWRRLAQISWHDLFYAEGAPGIPLFLDLKERIRREFEPDFLLIDARTGVTELGGVATSLLADDLVCLMAHNQESLEGSRAVLRSVASAERPNQGPPVRILPVVVRIPEGTVSEEDILTTVRTSLNEPARDLSETLSLDRVYVLHSEPDLQVAETLLIERAASDLASPLLKDYFRLFVQLLPPEIPAQRLRLLTERRTEYAPVAHRVLVRDDPAPAVDGDRTARWEAFSTEIRRLLAGDPEASAAIAQRDDAWQRAFAAGGAQGLAEAMLEHSTIDKVLVAMNEAYRSLDGRPDAARTVEDVLTRIVPMLYDKHLVYALPEMKGGVVLQIPVATATVAEILLASVDFGGLDYLPLTDPESFPEPATAIASLPEAGIDLSGDRAFEDFVDHLANAFVSEEDRRALGQRGRLSEQRYRQLLQLIDDELAWRSRQAVAGRHRYFLFDSRFARENGPFLTRLRQSLPALILVELTSFDSSDEERLCKPLRDFLYHSSTHQSP